MIRSVKFEFSSRSKYKFDDVELVYFKIKDLLKSLGIKEFSNCSGFSRNDSCDYYNIEIWCENNLKKDCDYYRGLKLDILSIVLKYLQAPKNCEIKFFEK